MSKIMKIAFANGGIIPASVLGKGVTKDRKLGPHEPIDVPVEYGSSLVSDRFAYEYDPKTAPKPAADPVNVAEEKAKLIVAEAEDKAQKIIAEAGDKAKAVDAEIAKVHARAKEEAEAVASGIVTEADRKAAEIIAAAEAKAAASPEQQA